jgi:hypothetical protein
MVRRAVPVLAVDSAVAAIPPRISLRVQAGRPSTGFALRLLALGCQAPLLGGTGRLRRPARLWGLQGLQDHLPKPVTTIFDIPALIPKPLSLDQQLAFRRYPSVLLATQAQPHIGWQASVGRHVPAQRRLAGDFIDVLTARTAGAGKGPGQFVIRDVEAVGDFHDRILPGTRKYLRTSSPMPSSRQTGSLSQPRPG